MPQGADWDPDESGIYLQRAILIPRFKIYPTKKLKQFHAGPCFYGRMEWMTIAEVIGLFLTEIVMMVGAVGSVIPAIPSTPVVFIAALGHKLYFGESSASVGVKLVLGLVMMFSLILDYVASLIGARKLGATWKGVVGALLGGMFGLLLGPWGILIGPFVGALAFEMIGGRNFDEATKAGTGALLGILAGTLGKFVCAIGMAGLFAADVIIRAFGW